MAGGQRYLHLILSFYTLAPLTYKTGDTKSIWKVHMPLALFLGPLFQAEHLYIHAGATTGHYCSDNSWVLGSRARGAIMHPRHSCCLIQWTMMGTAINSTFIHTVSWIGGKQSSLSEQHKHQAPLVLTSCSIHCHNLLFPLSPSAIPMWENAHPQKCLFPKYQGGQSRIQPFPVQVYTRASPPAPHSCRWGAKVLPLVSY